MSNVEYSVIMSDVIKNFDCFYLVYMVDGSVLVKLISKQS